MKMTERLQGIEKRLRGYLERFQMNYIKRGKKIDIDYIVGKIMTEPRKNSRSSNYRRKKPRLGNIHHPNYKGDNITR